MSISGQRRFELRRVIVGHEEGGTPEIEPLFANYFQFIQIGTDVFLDIGLISPDDVSRSVSSGAEADQAAIPATFYVLSRIAMSVNALAELHTKTNDMFEATKKAGGDILHAAFKVSKDA